MGGGGGWEGRSSCGLDPLFLGSGGGLDEGGGGTAEPPTPGGGGGRGLPTMLGGLLLGSVGGGGGGPTDGGLTCDDLWEPEDGLDFPPPGGGREGGGGGTPRGIPPLNPFCALSSALGFKEFGGAGGGPGRPGFRFCGGGFGGPDPGRGMSLKSGLLVCGGGGGGPALGLETLSLKSGLLVWGGGGGGPGRPTKSPFRVGLFCEGGGGGGPPTPLPVGPLLKLGLTEGPLNEGLFCMEGGGGGPPPIFEGPFGTGPLDNFVLCGIFTPPFVGLSFGIPPANNPPKPIGAPPPPIELLDSLSSWLRFHEFGMFLSEAPLLGRAATVLNFPPPPPGVIGIPIIPPPPAGFFAFPTTGALLSFVTVFFNFAPLWISPRRAPLFTSPPPPLLLGAAFAGGGAAGAAGGAGGGGGGGGILMKSRLLNDTSGAVCVLSSFRGKNNEV